MSESPLGAITGFLQRQWWWYFFAILPWFGISNRSNQTQSYVRLCKGGCNENETKSTRSTEWLIYMYIFLENTTHSFLAEVKVRIMKNRIYKIRLLSELWLDWSLCWWHQNIKLGHDDTDDTVTFGSLASSQALVLEWEEQDLRRHKGDRLTNTETAKHSSASIGLWPTGKKVQRDDRHSSERLNQAAKHGRGKKKLRKQFYLKNLPLQPDPWMSYYTGLGSTVPVTLPQWPGGEGYADVRKGERKKNNI